MERLASLSIVKEDLVFSAGHFTIFSETEREALHGHNYHLSVQFKVKIIHNGLAFDYRIYKQKLSDICKRVDGYFLLPLHSPYMQITEEGDYYVGHFNQQKIPFLKQDVILLPVTNISIEELSHWFLLQLCENETQLIAHGICEINLEVFNGPSQSGGAHWPCE